ncbi:MAG: mechanosensitive ion channel protein, partial [Arcobacter sp.]
MENIQVWIDKALPFIATYAMALVMAILIFVIGKWVAHKITNVLGKI